MPVEAKPAYYEGRALDRALMARYLRLLGPRFPLLEVGCGSVSLSAHPEARGLVVGLDHDAGALARRGGVGVAVDLEENRLPFRDRAFAAVLAKDVLEHVQRPWLLLREIARTLEPGGRIVVSVPMARGSRVWDDYTHVRGFTLRAIREMLHDTGFRVRGAAIMGGIPLTGRLGLADWIPALMKLPLVTRIYGRSHEVVAERA